MNHKQIMYLEALDDWLHANHYDLILKFEKSDDYMKLLRLFGEVD
jgi:hypothetical protein